MIKRNLKNILLIIVLIIICTGVGAYAYSMTSQNVLYQKPNGETLSVEVALDELDAQQRQVERFLQYTGNTKASDLAVGDTINYYYDYYSDPIECKVLYNDSYYYGIQVVSTGAVGSNITLGKTDPKIPSSLSSASDLEKATWSYNNAVYTLNSYAMDYVPNGGMALDGRCVGSNPLIGQKNSAESEPQLVASNDRSERSWMTSSGWYNTFKVTDVEYNSDYNAMSNLNIHNISQDYWLASRIISSNNNMTSCRMHKVFTGGTVTMFEMFRVGFMDSEPYMFANFQSFAFRPVFQLKPNIMVEKL